MIIADINLLKYYVYFMSLKLYLLILVIKETSISFFLNQTKNFRPYFYVVKLH